MLDAAKNSRIVLDERQQSDLGHLMMDFDCLISAFYSLRQALIGHDHERIWRKLSMRRMEHPLVRYANYLLSDKASDVIREGALDVAGQARGIAAMLGYSHEDRCDSPWIRCNPVNAVSYALGMYNGGYGAVFE